MRGLIAFFISWTLASTMVLPAAQTDTKVVTETVSEYPSVRDNEMLCTYADAKTAHVEYYSSVTYQTVSFDLTEEELEKLKELMANGTYRYTEDYLDADYTYTLHLFDDTGAYLYVVEVEADKETMYCEQGELFCEGLAKYIVSLCENKYMETLERMEL